VFHVRSGRVEVLRCRGDCYKLCVEQTRGKVEVEVEAEGPEGAAVGGRKDQEEVAARVTTRQENPRQKGEEGAVYR
jgi:hypothetical protein